MTAVVIKLLTDIPRRALLIFPRWPEHPWYQLLCGLAEVPGVATRHMELPRRDDLFLLRGQRVGRPNWISEALFICFRDPPINLLDILINAVEDEEDQALLRDAQQAYNELRELANVPGMGGCSVVGEGGCRTRQAERKHDVEQERKHDDEQEHKHEHEYEPTRIMRSIGETQTRQHSHRGDRTGHNTWNLMKKEQISRRMDRADRELSPDSKNGHRRALGAKTMRQQVSRGTIRDTPWVPQDLNSMARRNVGEAPRTWHPPSQVDQVQPSQYQPRVGRSTRSPPISSLSRRRGRPSPRERSSCKKWQDRRLGDPSQCN
jgi:hypothetical protein